jgi:hypothetical protein
MNSATSGGADRREDLRHRSRRRRHGPLRHGWSTPPNRKDEDTGLIEDRRRRRMVRAPIDVAKRSVRNITFVSTSRGSVDMPEMDGGKVDRSRGRLARWRSAWWCRRAGPANMTAGTRAGLGANAGRHATCRAPRVRVGVGLRPLYGARAGGELSFPPTPRRIGRLDRSPSALGQVVICTAFHNRIWRR